MISCILLSAGFSSRFGSPKALAQLRDTTVIAHLQNKLLKSQFDEIIVVLGAHMEQIKPLVLNHKKIKLVYNKDYNLGQTSSFKAGLKEVDHEAKAVALLPVDYPLILTETLNTLIAHFNENEPAIVVPTFNEKRGHPPIFSTRLKKEFLDLDTDQGINSIIHQQEDVTQFVNVNDSGVLKTFNTQEEFELIRVQEII